MRLLIETLAPFAVAIALFGAMVFVRRIWSGDPAIQAADRAKIGLVLSHTLPLMLACLVYSAVLRARLDIWFELAAMAGVAVTLGIAAYRYLRIMDVSLSR